MNVPRSKILVRGLSCACPNCGARGLFEPRKPFTLRRACERCALPFERDEGSFLGAVAINYGVTTVLFLVPVLLGYLLSWYSGYTASVLAGLGAVVVPIALYRPSRSWWLMNYYLVLPSHLPANQVSEPDRLPEH